MDYSEIGQRIRKQRELLGYTREQLAEMLDITPKFCSDIELGVKGMSISTLMRIAKALMLTTDYIIFGLTETRDTDTITQMLRSCDPSALPHVEAVIRHVLLALDMQSKKDQL